MQKLQELKKAIQTACPELLELSFGCYYKVPKRNKKLIYRIRTEQEIACVKSIEGVEILGHPITISHIFKAIKPYGTYDYIQGYISEINEKENWYIHKAKWNLKKDNLDEQSEETLNYLYEILCKKQ
jgi:hypothetical protein